MRYGLVGCMLLFAAPVWADYRTTPGTRFDLGELAREFKQVVPALEGCDDTKGTITCRRLIGDFTDTETAALTKALAEHDPEVRIKRKAQQATKQQTSEQAIKQKLGLSDKDLQNLKDALSLP